MVMLAILAAMPAIPGGAGGGYTSGTALMTRIPVPRSPAGTFIPTLVTLPKGEYGEAGGGGDDECVQLGATVSGLLCTTATPGAKRGSRNVECRLSVIPA